MASLHYSTSHSLLILLLSTFLNTGVLCISSHIYLPSSQNNRRHKHSPLPYSTQLSSLQYFHPPANLIVSFLAIRLVSKFFQDQRSSLPPRSISQKFQRSWPKLHPRATPSLTIYVLPLFELSQQLVDPPLPFSFFHSFMHCLRLNTTRPLALRILLYYWIFNHFSYSHTHQTLTTIISHLLGLVWLIVQVLPFPTEPYHLCSYKGQSLHLPQGEPIIISVPFDTQTLQFTSKIYQHISYPLYNLQTSQNVYPLSTLYHRTCQHTSGSSLPFSRSPFKLLPLTNVWLLQISLNKISAPPAVYTTPVTPPTFTDISTIQNTHLFQHTNQTHYSIFLKIPSYTLPTKSHHMVTKHTLQHQTCHLQTLKLRKFLPKPINPIFV
jgi:hypothetical protein